MKQYFRQYCVTHTFIHETVKKFKNKQSVLYNYIITTAISICHSRVEKNLIMFNEQEIRNKPTVKQHLSVSDKYFYLNKSEIIKQIK